MRVAMTVEQCWHRVPGGTARAALETAEAIERLDRVDLVGVSARHTGPATEGYEPPIPVAALPLPRLALYEAWHGLRWPPVERATGAVDVVHATGVAVPPRSVPLVVTLHDLAFLHDPSHFTRHGMRFFRRALALTRRDADLVLCSSKATLSDCIANGFDAARLRLVPLGVRNAPASHQARAEVRRAHRLDRPYVLFVGTLEPRKNLGRLLEAFALLKRDIDIVVVGPTGWGDDVAPQIAGLGDRAHRVGFVTDGELRALYAEAEVFCYPSLLEGFGLPVLEAMAQDTPVVTSRGSATEELVAGGAGLAVDPTSSAAIAGALGAVLDDPALASDMAQAGRLVAAAHTWERTAELTLAAYAEAVAT